MLAPYTDPDLWEGVALLALAPIIRKYKLYDKFKANTVFFERVANFTFYQWISIAGTIAFSLIMFTFTNFNSGTNIVLLRVATGSIAPEIVNGAGHYFVWVSLFVIYIRYGALDIVKAVFTMGFFGALHEDPWYIAYLYSRPETFRQILWFYSPFTILTIALLVFFIYNFRWTVIPRAKIFRAVVFIAVYYALWVAIGFPITIDNVTGNTPMYYSLTVNFIEDFSWIGLMLMVV